MGKMTRFGLALFACVCGLQVLPVRAATSADLRPVAQSKQVVYESYISKVGCTEIQASTVVFSGAASIFLGDEDNFANPKGPMDVKCPDGYALVNMSTRTGGGFQPNTYGSVTNTATAMCCPIKHRWAAPQIPA